MDQLKEASIYETVACNLCGSENYRVIIEPYKKDFNPLEVITASQGIRGTQRIVRCLDCGLVYVNPRINAAVVSESYAGTIDKVYVQGASGRQQTFTQCAKKIDRWKKPPGRLLDVGCAAGFFVNAAKKHGWDAAGVDPSNWLVKWGIENLGVKLYAGTLKDIGFGDKEFDVLTIWDVLEHVPDPAKELQECYRVLKKGGIIVINYPDFGSILSRLAGRRWWFLLSNHLYYFTEKTIRKYLENSGFKVEKFAWHWQTLPLGYLAKILGIYSQSLSRLSMGLFKSLRLSNVQIPYYAAQTNVIASKY
ncbi:MAG: class I SAM-dependent methyltransferase [Actinobacteria bacterium]|nr:class I SAM-dependent methyltransferase [Actinomycetota bacterium]